MDIEFFRTMVHITDKYFMQLVVGAIGSFFTFLSMHVLGTHREGKHFIQIETFDLNVDLKMEILC